MAKTPPNNRKPWTPSADAKLLSEIKHNTPTPLIALHTGRTEAAIRARAQELGESLKPVNKPPYGSPPGVRRKRT